ncbi:MAG: hypothetical protein GXP62_07405 [Oligoflexia bacterium]|nr:hypothetical protein [Oligoflexia bacterium]
MTDSLDPLRAAVQQSNRLLLPVCIVTVVAGILLAHWDGSALSGFMGFVTAATGAVFLVVWLRGHNAQAHPLVQAVRDRPQQVEWVHQVIHDHQDSSLIGATLHVGLTDGQTFALVIQDASLAQAAHDAIVDQCPQAARLSA